MGGSGTRYWCDTSPTISSIALGRRWSHFFPSGKYLTVAHGRVSSRAWFSWGPVVTNGPRPNGLGDGQTGPGWYGLLSHSASLYPSCIWMYQVPGITACAWLKVRCLKLNISSFSIIPWYSFYLSLLLPNMVKSSQIASQNIPHIVETILSWIIYLLKSPLWFLISLIELNFRPYFCSMDNTTRFLSFTPGLSFALIPWNVILLYRWCPNITVDPTPVWLGGITSSSLMILWVDEVRGVMGLYSPTFLIR